MFINKIHDKNFLPISRYLLTNLLFNHSTYYENVGDKDLNFLENHWEIKKNPISSSTNLRVDNVEEIYKELNRFLPAEGVVHVVEITTPMSARNINSLKILQSRLSQKLSVSYSTSPNLVDNKTLEKNSTVFVERMVDAMKHELLVGYEISAELRVKAGSIFCQVATPLIGSTYSLTYRDLSMLQACAQVHIQLKSLPQIFRPPLIIIGAGLFSNIHQQILDELQNYGADLSCILLNQIVLSSTTIDYFQYLCEHYNISLCVDSIGYSSSFLTHSFYEDKQFTSDYEIVQTIIELCRRGLSKHLVLSSSVLTRLQLSQYGGPGLHFAYQHSLEMLLSATVTPHDNNNAMYKPTYGFQRNYQLTEDIFNDLTCNNLLRLLSFNKPLPAQELEQVTLRCYMCDTLFPLGQQYTKFEFCYCSSKCLVTHRKNNFNKR